MGARREIDLAVSGGQTFCTCTVAESPAARARGLLGRSRLDPGSGLLLRPAWSIHTAFMRFPIDAVFLDRELRVLKIAAGVRPWRLAARLGAHSVLELPASACAGARLAVGDRLRASNRAGA